MKMSLGILPLWKLPLGSDINLFISIDYVQIDIYVYELDIHADQLIIEKSICHKANSNFST